jgi:hypothetical protein
MKNAKFAHIKEFIDSILTQLKSTLDDDTIDSINHYLSHAEYEMAFEGLFIEIMQLTHIPQIDLIKSQLIAKELNLDNESIFDHLFWKKFSQYVEKHKK